MVRQTTCFDGLNLELPWRLLLDHVRQGALVLDRNARLLYANQRFAELIGISRVELARRHLSWMVAPAQEDSFRASLSRAVPEGTTGHWSLLRQDGTVMPLEVTIYHLTASRESASGDDPEFAVLVHDHPESHAQFSAAVDSFLEVEERFRLATEALQGLVYEVNVDTQVIKHSAGLFDLLGFRPDEVPDYTEWWYGRIHPDDLRLQLERFQEEVRQHPTSFAAEYRIMHRRGDYVWVWDNSRLIYDEQGRLCRLVGCVLSIEGRKRAEQEALQSRRFLERVANIVPAILYIYDLDSERLVFTNRHVAHVLGYSSDEFLQHGTQLFAELTHSEDRSVLDDFLARGRRASDGETVSCGHRLRHADGSWRWFLSECTVLTRSADGTPTQILGAAADITELKRAEESLRTADRRKDDFLAILGHELRNPLAGIVGAVEVLNAIGAKTSECQEMRDLIARQTKVMQRLIDDLLDVARIARGKISLQRRDVDLRQLVTEVSHDAHRELEQRQLTLKVEVCEQPVWCHVDRERVRQVVANLLQNACKFTDPGGRIEISLRCEPLASMARLEVSDTGIGIDPAAITRLFEPFAQSDRTLDRSRGGLGLGLALVRGIVDLHGGEVVADSDGLGKGSRFILRLPLVSAKPIDERPAPPTARSPAFHSLTILVIDDRRDAALPAQRLLQRAGHSVHVAIDGPSGLAQAKALVPHIVLCDIGLPEMNGYEVARLIRSDPQLADAFLIAATGYGQENDRQLATAAGFDLHIAKPIDFDWLLEFFQSRRWPIRQAESRGQEA